MREVIEDALRGALVGAAGGAMLCALSNAARRRTAAARDIGVEVTFLRKNPYLLDMVARFQPLAQCGETRPLYEAMARAADDLMCICETGRRGAGVRANRAACAVKAKAVALCRLTLSKHDDERATELMGDVEALEGLCNDSLHNLLLRR